MSQTCGLCARVNAEDAVYCYHDGNLLRGDHPDVPADGASINFSTRGFPTPFVFPSGKACGNFNQLALACHEHRAVTQELLDQGFLGTFLSRLGRVDLAVAAAQAARASDRERGLDEFLGKLPAAALLAPSLRAEPAALDLGVFHLGQDHRFEIALHNDGMRLLHGAAVAECSWLTLGDTPGLSQKHFQFFDRLTMPIHVRGQALRAYNKPQIGKLVFDSNGGTVTVEVRVQVPVVPFPEGVLAGAISPRQLAEKAKARSKEAAILIANGAVARWYRTNNWNYPVPGPAATGLAAVQQLFEALGLVRIPKVEVNPEALKLEGQPGEKLETVLALVSQENRSAIAFAQSDQPWLEVGQTIFRGRVATIPVVVRIPPQPGDTLQACLTVLANGQQRFVVPVSLTIRGARPGAERVEAPAVAAHPIAALALEAPAVAALPVATVAPDAPGPVHADSTASAPPSEIPITAAPSDPRPTARLKRKHVLLAVFLLLLLLIAVGYGLFSKDGDGLLDLKPRLTIEFQAKTMTFGLHVAGGQAEPGQGKRLTFDGRGRTNNVCCRIDGQDQLLGGSGDSAGRWDPPEEPLGQDGRGRQRYGLRSIWLTQAKNIAITQEVEVVAGVQSRLLDTCLIRYSIENRDAVPHKVGLRFLLDTFSGARDGVPLAIPGSSELCATLADLKGAQVPDFVELLEHGDVKNPGTIAHVRLKVDGLEAPSRVTVGAWPAEGLNDPRARGRLTGWEVPVLSMKSLEPPDSAVTLYWEEKELPANVRRHVGFAYGLGDFAADAGGAELALSVGGSFFPGGEFTLTAYVKEPVSGQTLTLVLPAGLSLSDGQAQQVIPPVPAGATYRISPVTWRVQSSRQGRYAVDVRSSTGASQSRRITITDRRLFD